MMENNKPISLVLNELKTELAEIINSKNLPICLITPILKDFYLEAAEAERVQLEKDKQEYEKQQEKGEC